MSALLRAAASGLFALAAAPGFALSGGGGSSAFVLDPRLAELGFGAPSAPMPLQKPGQPEAVEGCEEKPTRGGKPAGYQILRKLAAETTLSVIANASSKAVEKVMTGQPINNNMQFRVVALNDAGESLPSNTVEVKL
jgi:hypothetical protein